MVWRKKVDEKTVEVPVPTQSPQVIKEAVTKQPSVNDVEAEKWVVKNEPTQYQVVIENQETGQKLDIYQAITELLNRTED